jgi:hypothetical protein
MRNVIFAATILVLLTGCAGIGSPGEPDARQLASANYGELTLEQADAKITESLSKILIYPSESHTSRVSGLDKHWMVDSVGNFCYGWLAKANVNARKKYGGYSGQQTYAFAFLNGEIVAVGIVNTKQGGISPSVNKLEKISCPKD